APDRARSCVRRRSSCFSIRGGRPGRVKQPGEHRATAPECWVSRRQALSGARPRRATALGPTCDLSFLFFPSPYLISSIPFLLGSLRRHTSSFFHPARGGERRRAHECWRGTRICAP